MEAAGGRHYALLEAGARLGPYHIDARLGPNRGRRQSMMAGGPERVVPSRRGRQSDEYGGDGWDVFRLETPRRLLDANSMR